MEANRAVGARVLAIDDDRMILDSIARQLRTSEITLDVESDPSKVISRLGEADYELVLCDIKMQPMNGLEVLEEIRKYRPDLPVIIVSAFVDDATVEAAKSLGCSEFLFKPVRRRTLIEAVERTIAAHRDA